LNIFIHAGDNRGQNLKWCKIGPHSACFWPPKCFGGRLRIFRQKL